MKKIVIGLLLGLIPTIFIGLAVRDTDFRFASSGDSDQSSLCVDVLKILQTADVVYKVKAGVPIKWQSGEVPGTLESCSEEINELPLTRVIGLYIKSWQFYANWIIFSIPFIGILYLIGKRHENHRH